MGSNRLVFIILGVVVVAGIAYRSWSIHSACVELCGAGDSFMAAGAAGLSGELGDASRKALSGLSNTCKSQCPWF